jgi:hypothetical protein
MEQTYITVYDILKTWPPIQVLVFVIIGFLIDVFLYRNAKTFERRNMMKLWLVGWILLGGLGAGNVLYQYGKCAIWARNNDYQVIEGRVENFSPMPYGGHQNELFSVNNVTFEYSDFDLSKCGFNQTASHGGPIREKLQVRISYRDGHILKIEILSNSQ